MLKRFVQFVVFVVGTGVIRWLWKLAENAILGWGDDQIALLIGIKSPAPMQVVNFLQVWAPPIIVMGLLMLAYHYYILPWLSRDKAAVQMRPVATAEQAPAIANPTGDTDWQRDWHELHLVRNDFWALVNKCYAKCSARGTESLQQVIARCLLPDDLPIEDSSTFSSWAWGFQHRMNVDSAEKDYALVLDQFANFIYDPNHPDEAECSALDGTSEFKLFDDKRRKLSKFWDHWGRQKSLDQLVTLQEMDNVLKSSAPELKLLTFLEIARARWRVTRSAGKSGLFLLAKRVN